MRRRLTAEDWRERLGAQYAVSVWLAEDFEAAFALVLECAATDDPWLNTGAVAPFGMKDFCRSHPDRLPRIMAVLEDQLTNRADPVRRNHGPYALGLLARTHPAAVRPYLEEWARRDDEQTRWNVASAFTQATGKRQPDLALRVLAMLVDDGRGYVRRAVARALANVSRHHTRKVTAFLSPTGEGRALAALMRDKR